MRRDLLAILLSLLAVAVLVRVAVIWHTGPMTDQGFYGDDSYMSHRFAANIAAGKGITQAGEPCNGFQPLFVFMLVPFYLVFDIYQATVASAASTSLVSVAGGFLMFLLARELWGVTPGLIALGLWTVSAHLTRVGLNGLETALANSMMLLVIWLHVRSARSDAKVGAMKGAGLGIVMGLALLARLDIGLLLLPLGLDQARLRITRRQYAGLAATVATGALVVLPWFGWSRSVCGSVVPVSGAATRSVSQLYGSPTGPTRDPTYFPLGDVPPNYYSSNLAHAGRYLVGDAPLNGPARVLFGRHTGVACASLAIIAALAVLANRGNSRPDCLGVRMAVMFRRLWFLWVFVVLLVGAYCFYYFAQWHYWRYMTPVTIAIMLPSTLFIQQIGRALLRWGRAGKVVAVTCVVGMAAAGAVEHAALFHPVDPTGIAHDLYHDAMTLDETLPPDARLASFESGTLDYFLARDVINLDGKTNAAAHRALIDGRMDRLVTELDIDYIVSSPLLIRDLLDRRGHWPPGRLEVVGRLAHNLVIRVNAPARAESGADSPNALRLVP